MKFKTILALVIAGLIVVFALQNSEVTDINFFLWKISMSRVLIILGSFSIGVIVGILVSMKKRLLSPDWLGLGSGIGMFINKKAFYTDVQKAF